jgi:hypothetical protein
MLALLGSNILRIPGCTLGGQVVGCSAATGRQWLPLCKAWQRQRLARCLPSRSQLSPRRTIGDKKVANVLAPRRLKSGCDESFKAASL